MRRKDEEEVYGKRAAAEDGFRDLDDVNIEKDKRACESKIVEQCEAGARIAASEKCKPPWWRALIGQKVTDLNELKQMEQCEEREMEGCLTAAKKKCGGFAKEKCLKPFRETRIAGVNVKQAERLVCWGTLADPTSWLNLIGLEKLGVLGSAMNYRAGELRRQNEKYHKTCPMEQRVSPILGTPNVKRNASSNFVSSRPTYQTVPYVLTAPTSAINACGLCQFLNI
ncbi:hypothetical protein DVH24_029223 [Malus domestica]|uniref:Uncharacterized protein n=1 Tax=Malus domestica TaxID=3750 RepID=A0A498HX10_MALDO|nr:hypothetical protein DVH24_029223 [Malus domestica]